MSTANLGIPYIAAAQNQPEVTANDAFDRIDAAMNGEVSFALTDVALAIVLTPAQFASAFVLVFTGALTNGRNVIVPTSKRFFVALNSSTGGFPLVVKTPTGTGVVVSATAGYVLLYCDGTNVIAVGAASSGGGGGPLPAPSTTLSLAPTASGNFQIAHLLSGTPRFVCPPQMTSGGGMWFQPMICDSVYVYLVASDAGVTGKLEVWL
jgi:hypothetical protein